tara:strand:- start:672 stop:1790 length:1119 start_codon:yes stop_codon:yes gene_type:complete
LKEIDNEKVLRVNMDGIYYIDHKVKILDTFRIKDDNKIPGNVGSDCFINNYDLEFVRPEAEYRTNHKVELCIGPGGHGKTYANIMDSGLVNSIYTAESWKLNRDKVKEFAKLLELDATVYARLLNENCHCVYNPSVIIIDEATMITNERKKRFMEMYPYAKLLFCGDFDRDGVPYQLPPTKGHTMDMKGIDFIRDEYHTNHRTQDKDLLVVLNKMRELIKDEAGQLEIELELEELMKKYGCAVDKKYVREQYKVDEYILCSRRVCDKCKEYHCDCVLNRNYVGEWTKEFDDKDKYLIKYTGGVYFKGEVKYLSKELADSKQFEKRHAFTIHSIQGITLDNKFYIDSRGFFDHRMAYVALSRAKSLSQIKYIV